MAEAASQSKAAGPFLDSQMPRSNGSRTSQSDQRSRYTPLPDTGSLPMPNNTKTALKPSGGVAIPWKSSPDQAAVRAARPQISSTPMTPSSSAIASPTKASPRPSGISSSKPQSSSTQLPGMGPVITPTRQLPSKSGSSSIRSAS